MRCASQPTCFLPGSQEQAVPLSQEIMSASVLCIESLKVVHRNRLHAALDLKQLHNTGGWKAQQAV